LKTDKYLLITHEYGRVKYKSVGSKAVFIKVQFCSGHSATYRILQVQITVSNSNMRLQMLEICSGNVWENSLQGQVCTTTERTSGHRTV